jgi:GT2 family glycosyltransferase
VSAAIATVDVLLPVFNGGRTLAQSLQSLADQTLADIRVLVVDDGSTDDTPEIARRFAAADPRFVHLRQPNGGIVAALNAGLEAARAPYVARLDADDLAYPERLRTQIVAMEREPDVIALGCQAQYIDADGARLPGQTSHLEIRPDYTALPAREPYIMHPFLVMRTAALRALGGYRHVPHAEDTDLYWRAVEIGRLSNLPDVLGAYRVHGDSITSRSALNGRVQAVASQLSAVSARRRAEGRQDFVFGPELKPRLEAAAELAAMTEAVAGDLTGAELAYLRVASAAKHLSTAFYRGYSLAPSDVAFAQRAFAQGGFSDENRSHLRWIALEVGRRLMLEGRVRDAARMLPPRKLAGALAKRALGRLETRQA